MFTGLVLETGRLSAGEPAAGGRRVWVEHSAALGERLEPGASLAVAGVCLTVLERRGGRSGLEIGPETAARTTLGRLPEGARVNLEPPLRLGDPVGGHWVQGHVDATVELVRRREAGGHRILRLGLPATLGRYVVEKGSVALDGVSLTVSARAPDAFEVALIPHTLEQTTLGDADAGDELNLEVDILAKYVEGMLRSGGETA